MSLLQQLGVLSSLATPTATVATPASSGFRATTACPIADKATTTAVAERWFQDAINPHQLAVLDSIVRPDIILHPTTFAEAHGLDAANQLFTALFAGFPDIEFDVYVRATQGDLVVERWRATGTHRGIFQGIALTGKRVPWTGTNIYRADCGKIVEVWNETDGVGRLQQIGGLPGSSIPPLEATPASSVVRIRYMLQSVARAMARRHSA